MVVEKLELELVKDRVPPIPVPLSCRWREFRVRVLPAMIFAGGLLTSALLWNQVTLAPDWPSHSLAEQTQTPLSETVAPLHATALGRTGEHRFGHHAQHASHRPDSRPGPMLTYSPDAPASPGLLH